MREADVRHRLEREEPPTWSTGKNTKSSKRIRLPPSASVQTKFARVLFRSIRSSTIAASIARVKAPDGATVSASAATSPARKCDSGRLRITRRNVEQRRIGIGELPDVRPLR